MIDGCSFGRSHSLGCIAPSLLRKSSEASPECMDGHGAGAEGGGLVTSQNILQSQSELGAHHQHQHQHVRRAANPSLPNAKRIESTVSALRAALGSYRRQILSSRILQHGSQSHFPKGRSDETGPKIASPTASSLFRDKASNIAVRLAPVPGRGAGWW